MKSIYAAVALSAFVLVAGCGSSDSDEIRSAAPDVGSETTPPPVPLPPETDPMPADSGPVSRPTLGDSLSG